MCEKGARIAELEREIATLETEWDETEARLRDSGGMMGDPFESIEEELSQKRAELARLRNESPALTQGEGSEPVEWQLAERHTDSWVGVTKYAYENYDPLNFKRRQLYASPPPLPVGNADPRVREALEKVYRYANRLGAPRWEHVPESLKTEWLSALPSPQSQGLVEAAEWLEEQARGEKSGTKLALSFFDAATALRGCARARSRAFDRSA